MMKPYRIALMMQGGTNWLGGINYIRNLVVALGTVSPARERFELLLLTQERLPADFRQEVQPFLKRIDYIPDRLPAKTPGNKLQWSIAKRFNKCKDPRFRHFLADAEIDFLYPYFSMDVQLPVHAAAWIPDFQHKHLPQFFDAKELESRDRHYQAIARHSASVVLSSEDARRDFIRFYEADPTKSRVLSFVSIPDDTWYSLQPADIQRQYNLPDRFFLISNQFWRHKNHILVLKALSLLQERSCQPAVVCTGNVYDYRNPGYTQEILQSIARFGLSSQVTLLGTIPRLEQLQLMRHCLTVIQPSLFEGWSTVVEDAKSLGKPILLSNLAVHREQEPPKSRFFDPQDPHLLADFLQMAWESLTPGPRPDEEELARNNARIRARAFAHQFLELAGLS